MVTAEAAPPLVGAVAASPPWPEGPGEDEDEDEDEEPSEVVPDSSVEAPSAPDVEDAGVSEPAEEPSPDPDGADSSGALGVLDPLASVC